MTGIRYILGDGTHHPIDSSELAFRLAEFYAFREKSRPTILEPVVNVQVTSPIEFQGSVIGSLNKRKGTILDTEIHEDYFVVNADVTLNNMFGYASELRGATEVNI